MPTHNVELGAIKEFLKRYNLRRTQLENLRYQYFRSDFLRIAAGLQSVKRLGAELEKVKAQRFNIFTLLGVSTSEVKTHSALLADILNPTGTHGQGNLFLSLFLNLPSLNFKDSDIVRGPWIVQREKVTSFGNMDLFLAVSKQRRCIIIENKIDAEDQSGQMSRYFRWLKDSPYDLNSSRLIYLTREGRPPSVFALSVDGKEDEEARSYITLLSYKSDIVPLLTSGLHKISVPNVRETLFQYCELFVKPDN